MQKLVRAVRGGLKWVLLLLVVVVAKVEVARWFHSFSYLEVAMQTLIEIAGHRSLQPTHPAFETPSDGGFCVLGGECHGDVGPRGSRAQRHQP